MKHDTVVESILNKNETPVVYFYLWDLFLLIFAFYKNFRIYATNTSLSSHDETRMMKSHETFEAAAKRVQEGAQRPVSSHAGNIENYIYDEGLFEKVEIFFLLSLRNGILLTDIKIRKLVEQLKLH